MRTVLLVWLLLSAAAAQADEGSCTFTWNPYSRSIVRSCASNIPMPGLNMQEQIALKSGKAKACTITVETSPDKRKVRDVRRSCQ